MTVHKSEEGRKGSPGIALTPGDRGDLVRAARHALALHFRGPGKPVHVPKESRLHQPGSAFVTLKKGSELRGCIGSIQTDRSLLEVVADSAVAAATRDPRFPPVLADELPDLQIQVSVLGPLKVVKEPEEVEIGRHGLRVCEGAAQGLLLPQVATEMQLDAVSFLEWTCLKAGLPRDAWRKGATIQVFTADVFPPEP
ncbi:MAG: AmmeMemoRadiSam system protein A [Acidobacteriota bacterium]